MLVSALVAFVGLFVSSPVEASLPAAGEIAAPLAADPFTQLIEASARPKAQERDRTRLAQELGVPEPLPLAEGLGRTAVWFRDGHAAA